MEQWIIGTIVAMLYGIIGYLTNNKKKGEKFDWSKFLTILLLGGAVGSVTNVEALQAIGPEVFFGIVSASAIIILDKIDGVTFDLKNKVVREKIVVTILAIIDVVLETIKSIVSSSKKKKKK